MTNLNRARGFECKGTPLRVNPYTAGGTVYPGDMLLEPQSNGKVVASAGAASEMLLGVALNYAIDTQTVMVADHPSQQFIVQMNSGETEASTQMGDYCEVRSTAGDTTYKQSRQEVDTVAETNTKPLRVVALDTVTNNSWADNADVVVVINTHALTSRA
jgi:hypothetical protein